MIRYTLCFLIASWLVAGGSLQAITITENFDDGSLDPNFTEFLSPGFEIAYVGGEAVFTRPAGPASGAARIDSLFSLDGDFTITVDATRTSVTGALGLVTIHDPDDENNEFTDVFFNGANFINANIFVSPGFGSEIDGDSSGDAIFQIRRVGQTIFEEYDTGSGMQTLHFATHANLAGPVTLRLFLLQGQDGTLTHQGSFDNLTVTADRFVNYVPEPSSFLLATIAMALFGAGRLLWVPR